MTTPPPAPPPSRPTRQLSGLQIVFAAIVAIGLLLAINFSARITAGQRIQRDRQMLEMEIATLEAEQITLQQALDFARSDEYVEAWARSEGKMVREGEVLVIPVPAGVPEPTPSPTLPALPLTLDDEPALESWRVWWALFFDDEPPF